MSDLVERLRAASHDERLSTGMLYREAADMIERLRAERDALYRLCLTLYSAHYIQSVVDAALAKEKGQMMAEPYIVERHILDLQEDNKRLRAERDALRELLRRWVDAADNGGGEVWCGMPPNDELLKQSQAVLKEGKP